MFTSLLPTPEQTDLRSSVRRFLGDRAPIASARAVVESGARDPDTWRRLATEIGVGYLLLPEDLGGLPDARVELCVVAEEAGFHLLTAPLLPSVLAARLLARAGVKDEDVWDAIGEGAKVAVPVLAAAPGTWSSDRVSVTAQGGRLNGRCDLVMDDATGDWLLTAATTPDGLALFLVDANSTGVRRTVAETLDRSRALCTVELVDVEARELAASAPLADAIGAAYDDALVVLAAEQVGVAQRALGMAVEYVRTREQFGRPVGSFQAVKHLLAEALVEVESARSAVTVAAHSGRDVGWRASLTVARCSQVAVKVTETSIQAHAGIGYTWEHDAHLLLKRARANSVLLGSPGVHRRRVLDSMGA